MLQNSPSLSAIAELMDELRAYAGQNIVIKIGGNSIAEDADFLSGIARQLEFLHSRHVCIVLVHGGGPQIDHALLEAGIKPVKGPDGRRITDPATMAVVARTMAAISGTVTLALAQEGCAVYAAAADQACFVTAEPLRSDAQDRTARPAAVDRDGLLAKLRQGRVVVLNSVGRGTDGLDYNINADDYAMAVAVALGARRLILATNVNGVYDKDKKPISLLTPVMARDLMASGVIAGGMIPKVESALNALQSGVGGVAIIDAHQNWSLLGELLTQKGFGTLITARGD